MPSRRRVAVPGPAGSAVVAAEPRRRGRRNSNLSPSDRARAVRPLRLAEAGGANRAGRADLGSQRYRRHGHGSFTSGAERIPPLAATESLRHERAARATERPSRMATEPRLVTASFPGPFRARGRGRRTKGTAGRSRGAPVAIGEAGARDEFRPPSIRSSRAGHAARRRRGRAPGCQGRSVRWSGRARARVRLSRCDAGRARLRGGGRPDRGSTGPFGPAPRDGGPKRTDPGDGGADRSPRGLGGRVRLP